MAYKDSRGFTDSLDNQKDFNDKYVDADSGPYVGVVKYVNDPLRMGRLGVNIPALSTTNDPSPGQVVWCQYLSPFYGAKSVFATSDTDPYDYKSSQHSYGFWAVPPDIDTSVLVIFAKGDAKESSAYWIGCIQDPLTNHMIPGHGATTQTSKKAEVTEFAETSKIDTYGTNELPAGEKNRRVFAGESIAITSTWKYPINEKLADQLKEQGLILDNVRGTTTSSARRESPSQVFGLNTPGRILEDSATPRIGLNGSPVVTDRESGHSFVMDDGDVAGDNQLIRLRSASGHQILMHDTKGTIYIANASGNSWIEMTQEGKIHIFSEEGINVRTDGDFNVHSEADINFHAKEKIKFTAQDDVVINAEDKVVVIGEKGILSSAREGTIKDFARDITSYSKGVQLHGSGGTTHIAGSAVHLNSVGASSSWGHDVIPSDFGIAEDTSKNDVDVDDNGILRAKKKKTKTTIPKGNFVTHEPFERKADYNSGGTHPYHE